MAQFGVVLFYTTSAVMRAEKMLKKSGYAVKLVPTPREFSSDCGIALRFDWDRRDQVHAVLEEAKVEFSAIHQLGA
ncbi:MAG: DUF3343 domain-containing protein [Candidatus Coatesbacteria bacterium]|nr:DUF3343 domain-containing protein [Candidatus Coatesbacteria bacterium]